MRFVWGLKKCLKVKCERKSLSSQEEEEQDWALSGLPAEGKKKTCLILSAIK